MRRKLVVLGVLGISGGLLAISACVGDDPAGPDTNLGNGGDSGTVGVNTGDSSNNNSEGSVQPGSDSGAETSAPNVCAATPTGAFVNAGQLDFYGSHQGVAATSNGWTFAGFAQNHGTITYDPDAAAIGDAGNPTQGASAARVDAKGNVIWQQLFSGDGPDSFTSVAVDEHDNVYAAGWTESTSISFGTLTLNAPAGFAANGFVVKLDAQTGTPIWAQIFPTTSGFGCNAIDYANGNLVVSCAMTTSQTYATAAGAKTLTSGQQNASSVYGLDPNTGNAVWADSFSTPAGTNTGVQTLVSSVDVNDTTVVFAGTFGGSQNMTDRQVGAVNVAPTGDLQTGFVVELTADKGLYEFAKPFGGTTDAGTIALAVATGSSADGGIYVGGSFAGTVSFAQPHASINSTDDAFVFLLDNKASPPAWEKIIGGTGSELVRGILIDNCGHPEISMGSTSQLGTIDGVKIPPAGNGPAMIVAKMSNTTGSLLWAQGTTSGGNSDTGGLNPTSFTVDATGHTRIVGRFRGPIDFGSGTPSFGPNAATPFFVDYAP